MQFHRTFAGTAAAVLAVALATPCVATATDPRAGIAHAKAAGIDIDPAAEELMAEAPIGTCWNDPALEGCPVITAAIYEPAFFGMPEASARPADASHTSHRLTRLKASAAGFIDQCMVKVNDGSPYAAAGYAQMNAQSYCSTKVTANDDYLLLQKYDLNYQAWRNIKSKWYYDLIEGKFHHLGLTQECTTDVPRDWKAEIDGYAVLQGIMYSGSQTKKAEIDCNFP